MSHILFQKQALEGWHPYQRHGLPGTRVGWAYGHCMEMHSAANWNQNASVKWLGVPDFGCTVLVLQHVGACNHVSRSLSLPLVFGKHVTPRPSNFRGWGCNGF